MASQASQISTTHNSWAVWLRITPGWSKYLVMVVLFGGMMFLLFARLSDPGALPIKKIRVQGALVKVDEPMLQEAMYGKIQGGFFSLDVNQVRIAVEQLPWVRSASVRKVWPDTIIVVVTEQRAVAKWGNGGLVNAEGMVFTPEKNSIPQGLPEFSAPEGMSKTVMQYFDRFNRQLFSVSLQIRDIQLDARRAVKLELDNNIILVLGRETQDERLQRFVKIYSRHLYKYADEILRVDLRYSNGMAVQWRNRKIINKVSQNNV